jgi:hypothetical protein
VTRVLKVPERAAAAQPDAEPALPWSRRKHQVNGSDRVSATYRASRDRLQRVLCQNLLIVPDQQFSLATCSAILADQPADDAPALDPGGDIDNAARLALRGFLSQGLVRPMSVVVPGVFGHHFPQGPLAEDQHVVEALTA